MNHIPQFRRPGWLCLLLLLVAGFGPVSAQTPRHVPPLLLSVGTNYQMVIPRPALGREYLLSASLIPQQTSPTSTGLAGKIVRFELFHDGVDLYESTKGLVVTEDLPARRLLTTFPIISQDDRQVVIDFNRGMRRVFTDIWYGGGNRDRVLEVLQSRVFAAEARDEILALRQSVQARDLDNGASVETRFELRYFFSAYEEPVTRSREQSAVDTRYARFFETAPVLETTTGRSSTHMARFDLAKPIIFHYSANTPSNYVDAVRDGILYWNRAFGTNVVRAEKAPEGVTAPDPRYNIVQWVPWDGAGSAYADILVDPRTGDSVHGQAYMTSVFAISGRARARAALRSMRELIEGKKDGKGGDGKLTWPDLGLPIMESANACQVNPIAFAQQYAAGLEELLASDQLTDAAVLRASQDYVREVVAHEVGHVLGLRHNFAGSLAATMSPKELDEWFQSYVTGKGVEAWTNRLSSSSMMEYSVFKAGVFIGWQMRTTTTNVLPHDKAAIQWGYFEGKEPQEQKLLFGTDQDSGRYVDVRTFDYGNRPVLAIYSELSAALKSLPNTLIERFIAARAPRDPRDRVPLEQVNLSVTATANQLAGGFSGVLALFQSGSRSLAVENQFDFIGDLNLKERHEAHWKSVTEEFEKLGGMDRVLFAPLPADLKLELKKEPEGVEAAPKLDAAGLTSRLEKLLVSPAYTNFVGLDEKRYSFTEPERKLISERSRKFFKDLESAVLKHVLIRLENAPRDLAHEATGGVGEEDLVAQFERRTIELARSVLLAKDESTRIKGKVDKSYVEVVDYKFDHETRMAAAKALNDKTGSFRGWATDAKGDLNKSLKEDVDGVLNIANFKEFKDSQLSRPLREWYLRQQDLLALLPPKAK